MTITGDNINCAECRKPQEKGYALVMVVWIMAILTMLALGFSRHITVGSAGLGNAIGASQAEILAQSALERGIHALLNPGERERWKLDGTAYQFSYKGAVLTFSLEDEHGKIDLNFADRQLLLALFEEVLSARTLAEGKNITPDMMVDRLLDWRDADDLPRLEGAEFPEYEAMAYEVGPANRPFRSVSELQQLLGMDRTLYEDLVDMVTVHSFEGTINPEHAGARVLKIIPGVVDGEVDLFLSMRAENDYANSATQLPVLTGGNNYLDRKTSTVYTITGRADLPSRISYLKKVILWKVEQGQGPLSRENKWSYKILEVRENSQISSGVFAEDNLIVFVK